MTVERFLSDIKDFTTGKRIPYCPKCGFLISYHAMKLNYKTSKVTWIMRARPGVESCVLTDKEMDLIKSVRDRIVAE